MESSRRMDVKVVTAYNGKDTSQKTTIRPQKTQDDYVYALVCVGVCVCLSYARRVGTAAARARLMRGCINKKDTHCET